jgi:hypothetical protein
MNWQLPNCGDVFKSDAGLTATLGANKIFQTRAPETATGSYLVWQLITGQPENTLGCVPDIDDQRVRVSIYSRDAATARRACEYATAAAEANLGDIIFGPVDSFEPITKNLQYIFDVEIWNKRK